jgi:hypothetical protein
MKIRFIKMVLVEINKSKLDEVWDKSYSKWDEVDAESITYANKKAEICTKEGDTLLDVPIESFEVVHP